MRSVLRGGIVALFGLVVLGSDAAARRIAIPPLTDRFAQADAVIAGKVTALDAKKAKLPDGSEGILATIKVENAVLGPKGLTHVKVAVHEGQLTASQEGCFFL